MLLARRVSLVLVLGFVVNLGLVVNPGFVVNLGLVVPVHGMAADPQRFGEGVSLTEVTPLARVVASPSEFDGQTVRIDGIVTAVCEDMGCWMSFAPENMPEGATFLVKVDDGVIVFPVSAKGRRASAQGVIQRVPGTAEGQEAANEHARHAAAAAGAPAPAPAPTAWQLKATGAIVY